MAHTARSDFDGGKMADLPAPTRVTTAANVASDLRAFFASLPQDDVTRPGAIDVRTGASCILAHSTNAGVCYIAFALLQMCLLQQKLELTSPAKCGMPSRTYKL